MRKTLFYLSITFYFFSFIILCTKPDAIQAIRNQLYDADLLFPFSLYNGLLHSGNMDWTFSGIIPYFPDLFWGFIFWFLLRNIHLTIAAYAIFQVTFLACSAMFLAKSILGRNLLVYSLILIFSSIPIFLLASGELLFFYLLSWYKHTGVIGLTFIALGLLIQLMETNPDFQKRVWWKLAALAILTIAAVASDALFVVQFIAPAIAVLIFLRLVSLLQTDRMALGIVVLLFSTGIGFSLYDLPQLLNCQRIELFQSYIHPSPENFINNWKTFYNHFINLFDSHGWMIVWTGFYLACFIIAVTTIRSARENKVGWIRKRALILSLFLLIQVPAIVGAIILSGSTEVWYFHPITFISLIWGWPLIAGCIPDLFQFIRQRYTIVASIAGLISTMLWGYVYSNYFSTLVDLTDYYPPMVACVDEKVGSLGLNRGIAQYWLARPITLLSKRDVVVVQVSPDLRPFYWENCSDWYSDDFEFIIVDQPVSDSFSIRKETVIDRFGEPAEVLSCDRGEILVYNRSADASFRDQFVD